MEKLEIIADTSGSMGNSDVDLKKETTKYLNNEITTIGKEVKNFIHTDTVNHYKLFKDLFKELYKEVHKAQYIALAKSIISDIVDIHNCKIDYIYKI